MLFRSFMYFYEYILYYVPLIKDIKVLGYRDKNEEIYIDVEIYHCYWHTVKLREKRLSAIFLAPPTCSHFSQVTAQ